MSHIFPSFFMCPICGIEFVNRIVKSKLECPKCDFAGSRDHFILSKTQQDQDMRIPHHPLSPSKTGRENKMTWIGTDWFFLGFPPRNRRKVSI